MKNLFKYAIRNSLFQIGYEISKKKPIEHRWNNITLRSLSSNINSCIDVGVGFGTPTLYEAFPNAFHILIEPIQEYEPFLKEILLQYKGAYFLTALGSEEKRMQINIELDSLTKSSFYKRTPLTEIKKKKETREISIKTLDDLIFQNNFTPPFGLKIDTEGFELEVIKGAKQTLKKTNFVIAEISYSKRFEESYSLKYNVTGIPKNKILHKIFFKSSLMKSILKPLIPGNLRKNIVLRLKEQNLEKPEFPLEVRQQLLQKYQADIIKLQDLIKKDLSIWLES